MVISKHASSAGSVCEFANPVKRAFVTTGATSCSPEPPYSNVCQIVAEHWLVNRAKMDDCSRAGVGGAGVGGFMMRVTKTGIPREQLASARRKEIKDYDDD